MSNIYSYIIPLIIIGLNFWGSKTPIGEFSGYVKIVFRAIPHLFGYLFFLYYLGQEHNIDVGYSPIAIAIFLIPISLIVCVLRVIYWIKNKS